MGGWNKLLIPKECLVLLGTMSDTDIGRIFGFNKSVIARNRRKLGIKAFPCKTRFTKGVPHPGYSQKRSGG